MKIQAENSKLKPIFRILYDNISDGFIQITENKLIIESADPANTMMFSIEAEADFFDTFEPEIEEHESYQYENEEGLIIGCYLDGFYPILKKFSSSDDIALLLKRDEITIASGDHIISRKTLDLDVDNKLENVNQMDLKSNFSVKAEEFVDSIDKLSVFEDNPVHVDITDHEMKMNIQADVGSASSVNDLESWNEESCKSMFGIDLLKDLSKAIQRLHSADDDLKMRMEDEHPIESILDQENLKLSIFVAPRIEEK